MNIEVGSKWIRSKLYWHSPNEDKKYFIGQEVEVIGETVDGFVSFIYCERSPSQGLISKRTFLKVFKPDDVTLENK